MDNSVGFANIEEDQHEPLKYNQDKIDLSNMKVIK